MNGADTQVEDFIDDEDGSATTSGTKVTKNYDGQSALLTFHAKYDINKINQSQNWVVEHTVVGAGASTGLLKKADADSYYAPKSAVEVLETDVWDYDDVRSIILRGTGTFTLNLAQIPANDRHSWLNG